MKAQDLPKVWDTPDLSRLSPKPTSIRLPVILNAKISALGEMYPNKTKTDIINDLLASALEDLSNGLPSEAGEIIQESQAEGEEDLYDDIGLKGRFIRLTNKHITLLEQELGNDKPDLLPYPVCEKD
ncbi:MAG: hypothetical protein OEV92_00700 [Nitrospinota bacterium]|nr:hypothetical protein [Nitrospinota bacterium]